MLIRLCDLVDMLDSSAVDELVADSLEYEDVAIIHVPIDIACETYDVDLSL